MCSALLHDTNIMDFTIHCEGPGLFKGVHFHLPASEKWGQMGTFYFGSYY